MKTRQLFYLLTLIIAVIMTSCQKQDDVVQQRAQNPDVKLKTVVFNDDNNKVFNVTYTNEAISGFQSVDKTTEITDSAGLIIQKQITEGSLEITVAYQYQSDSIIKTYKENNQLNLTKVYFLNNNKITEQRSYNSTGQLLQTKIFNWNENNLQSIQTYQNGQVTQTITYLYTDNKNPFISVCNDFYERWSDVGLDIAFYLSKNLPIQCQVSDSGSNETITFTSVIDEGYLKKIQFNGNDYITFQYE